MKNFFFFVAKYINKVDEIQKRELLDILKTRLSELITLYERVKEENVNLIKQNQKLLELNNKKEEEIQNFKEKLETYKLTNSFILTSEGEDLTERKHDAKIKINRLIKEIDSCLALLNR